MIQVTNVTEVENANTVTTAMQGTPQTTEAAYVKPAIEVIDMEMEGAILSDSAGDGGYYPRNW